MASTEDANATRQLPHREGQGGSAVQREDAGIGSSGQPRPAEALGAQPNPWKMKAILTLDGGGVRGYGSLLMLRDLMKKIQEVEEEFYEDDSHASSFHPFALKDDEEELDISQGQLPTRPSDLAPRISDLGSQERTPISTKRRRFPLFRKKTVPLPRDVDDIDDLLKPSWDGYFPCHYFDYIGGTSTGGLNAIMLGRLRMDVNQCIANYPNMATNIFSFPRNQIKGWPHAKHDSRRLETEIKRVIACRLKRIDQNLLSEKAPKPTWKQFPCAEDLCRTVVVAKKKITNVSDELYLFRTYSQVATADVNWGPPDKLDIYQVGRATSAAPTFFEPLQINGIQFSDGGLGFNNPAQEVFQDAYCKEASDKDGEDDEDTVIDFVLSIGTGGDDKNSNPANSTTTKPPGPAKRVRKGAPKFLTHLSHLSARLTNEVTNVDRVDRAMRFQASTHGFEYYRWTGGADLAGIQMDEWKAGKGSKPGTQDKMDSWIRDYMGDDKRQTEMAKIARFLVERRRSRCADADRWARFSHCTRVRCEWCRDKNDEMRPTRAEFVSHCRRDHPKDHPQELETYAASLQLRSPQIVGGPY